MTLVSVWPMSAIVLKSGCWAGSQSSTTGLRSSGAKIDSTGLSVPLICAIWSRSAPPKVIELSV